jgi:type I restriction enzyme M protein
VAELDAVAEEASRAVEEFIEENATEEGLLSEAMDDGKVTKALAAARLKEAKREGSDPDEVKALEELIDLYAKEANAKKKAKDARGALDLAVLKQYGEITEADIRPLVCEDKWLASIQTRISSEVDALTLALVERIQQLGERYGETANDLGAELEGLQKRLAGHLSDMGIKP